MSTTVPRDAFRSDAPFFICPSSAAPIMRLVCGVSGTWSVTKSPLREHFCHRGGRAVVAHRQLGRRVPEDDAQAHRFGENAKLRADVAVTDDAERLAADLVRADRDLPPFPLVHFARAVAELTRERDDLADDQLGDAAGVAEWRVEDRNAAVVRVFEIDLVGPDAEAAEGDEARRVGRATSS